MNEWANEPFDFRYARSPITAGIRIAGYITFTDH